MPVIDKELGQLHMREERKLRFTEFVKEQKASGSPGNPDACLQSNGHRDYYGSVVFERGWHDSHFILPADRNKEVLLYKDKRTAKAYAKELQTILRSNGYPMSKVWVEQVAVRSLSPRPYSSLMAPSVSYEAEDRFLIRMKVR